MTIFFFFWMGAPCGGIVTMDKLKRKKWSLMNKCFL